jgi:uncharacterized protein (TIGR03118 family)
MCMEKLFFPARMGTRIVLLFSATMFLFLSCRKLDKVNPILKHFNQVNLVDNNGENHALHQDPNLINAWGMAWTPNGFVWVNAEAGHLSFVYNGDGGTIRPPVAIPSPMDFTSGHPTGIVFNSTDGFMLTKGGPARFIFVGVDGVLSAWNQEFGNTADRIKDNSATSAYTGLAMAMVNGDPFLYAADFRANKIVVWNKDFGVENWPFVDPNIPAGFAPFNIQSVGDWLYVMYAKVGEDGEEEVGDGLGYVDIYKPTGELVKRFASQGALNAPWGVTSAPASFFKDVDEPFDNLDGAKGKIDPHDLNLILIGNFGNGYINAYTQEGLFLGPLKSKGEAIEIEGLWAISFPPATAPIDHDRLYFAAGPDDEEEGLFGYIIKK